MCEHVLPPKPKLQLSYYVKYFQTSEKSFPKRIVLFLIFFPQVEKESHDTHFGPV